MSISASIPACARVVKLLGPRRLVWVEEPLPTVLADDSLLCRTLASAISPGTELAAYTGARPLRDVPAYPRVQGYCNVSEIVAVGSRVTAHEKGDRVLSFMSHRSHSVLAEADALLKVPASIPVDHATMTYLFHLGYNALLRADARAGHRVAVLGLGALGLATVAVARLAGVDVMAVSSHDAARRLAASFGAVTVLDRTLSPEHHGWADVVVVTTNSWHDWQLALQLAAHRGAIAVLGFPGRENPPGDFNPLDSRYFYNKQLRIEAVGMSPERADPRGFTRFNERDNLRYLLERIGAGALPAAGMISGRFPAERIVDAYEGLLERRDSPVTYVLEWP